MPAASELESTLLNVLPAEFHTQAPRLARLLCDAAAGQLAPDELQQRLSGDLNLTPLLAALAGQSVAFGSTTINFSGGEQRGANTLAGNIAGRDLIVVQTGGGDYAGGDIDKRQGRFFEGGIHIHYSGHAVAPGSALPYLEPVRPPEMADFVGRETELAYFAEKLATSHLAIISGMAGVGKTSLAAALARQVAAPENIFWHAFHEGEGIDAIIWKLAGFLAWHGQDDLWQLLQNARLAGGQPPPPELLCDYLAQAIAGQGYIVCLDDFQFVDDDPLLDQLVRRLRGRVLAGDLTLIVTARRVPAFAQTLEFALLGGLSAADTRRLLEARGLALADDLAADLHARTEGNVQLLTLAIDALQRAADPARLIAQLAEAEHIERYLMAELDAGLTDDEQAVMSAIAVLMGYPGTRDAIEAIAEISGVRRILSDLSGRSLLTAAEGERGREYRQHAIVQAFYYNLLGQRERQALHLRAGNYYETEEPDALKAARHFMRIGEHAHAAGLVTSGVEALIARGQARALLHLLVELPTNRIEPELRLLIDETRGDLEYLLGELNSAVRRYTHAIRAAVEGDTLTQARLHRKLGDVLARKSKNQAALACLARGRALLQAARATPVERARLAVGQGTVLVALGRYDEAAAEAQAALDQLGETANPRIAADLHDVVGKVRFFKGEFAGSLERFQAALELRRACADQQGTIKSYSNQAVVYGEQNRYAEALRANQAALEIAEHIGDTVALDALYTNMAADSIEQGDYNQAIEFNQRSLALCEKMGNTHGMSITHRNLGEVYRHLERFGMAVEHLSCAIEFANQADDRYGAIDVMNQLAEIHLAQGQIELALARCQEALHLSEDTS
jgi:ATP/maltotriose-dependent transcriptional regulator MalT